MSRVCSHPNINKPAMQSLFPSSSAQGSNPHRQMIHSLEHFRMKKEQSQPIGCVRPGPEPAQDLHLGSDCEPQQPMPLVKELLGMGMGETQYDLHNLMDQKRPWGEKTCTQTGRKSLGRAPFCQGPLRKRLLPSPGSSCLCKCPH